MATATLTKTDREIQQDVMNELKWDARLQPNEIGVIVKDGIVTLTGWVDSYLKKWEAEDAAQRVAGVKAVANDIEVKLLSERTDLDIARAATNALEWDAALPPGKVKVVVSKGWVTLQGEVEWQFQKSDAELPAGTVFLSPPGLRRLKWLTVTVIWWSRPSCRG
jgi:osmotically-inducible protein OsmY